MKAYLELLLEAIVLTKNHLQKLEIAYEKSSSFWRIKHLS